MAGRPRKSTFINDISEIGTSEEKEIVEKTVSKKPEAKKVMDDIIEKAEIAPEPSNANTGIVKVSPEGSWLNVRSAPFGEIVGSLNNGAKVTIYETMKGWGKISDTEEKWVNLEFIV